jgi:hypothetical protein
LKCGFINANLLILIIFMKKKPFKLTEQLIKIWKDAVITYLKGLYSNFPKELEEMLLLPDVLNPVYKYRGELLLQPGIKVTKAYYLKKGLAKLYSIDGETGFPKLFYIWDAASIVVLYKAFREKLPNDEFYIELMEDSELVSISNFWMDDVYEAHPVAHELTGKILSMKTERRMLQTDILTMVDKKRRYCAFKKKFPELFEEGKPRLSNEEICAFINISESTLLESRKICPDA